MHSPVLVNYDPAVETASLPSDWEYYSDDYWDHDSVKRKTRKLGKPEDAGGNSIVTEERISRRRRKPKSTDCIPGLVLGEPRIAAPTVVWREKKKMPEPPIAPAMDAGNVETVSLLEDWRKRFKLPIEVLDAQPEPMSMQRKGSQRATAVLIDSNGFESSRHATPPPTTRPKAQGLPSWGRVNLSPTRKTTLTSYDTVSGGSLEDRSQEREHDHLINDAVSNSRKRKAHENPTADTADSRRLKRRPGRPKKSEVLSLTQDAVQKSPENPIRIWSNTGKENAPGTLNKSFPLRQKRRLVGSEGSGEHAAKRSKKGAESLRAATVEANGSSARRSTRKKPIKE